MNTYRFKTVTLFSFINTFLWFTSNAQSQTTAWKWRYCKNTLSMLLLFQMLLPKKYFHKKTYCVYDAFILRQYYVCIASSLLSKTIKSFFLCKSYPFIKLKFSNKSYFYKHGCFIKLFKDKTWDERTEWGVSWIG